LNSKGGDKPGTGEAQRNKSFFEARKAGSAGKGQLGPKPGGMENTICLCCRQRGHLAKHCPKNANQGASKQVVKFRCYNCGEEGHSIHACTKPKKEGGKLEFAVCFVCQQPVPPEREVIMHNHEVPRRERHRDAEVRMVARTRGQTGREPCRIREKSEKG